jgi:hypothetical protein
MALTAPAASTAPGGPFSKKGRKSDILKLFIYFYYYKMGLSGIYGMNDQYVFTTSNLYNE